MIFVYPPDCTDFSTNGNGALSPISCEVTETLNGEYEVEGCITLMVGQYIIHEPVRCTGVPKCAYIIGDITIECDGSINTDNTDAWAAMRSLFTAYGWEKDARAQMQEHLEAVAESSTEELIVSADLKADTPERVDISYQLTEFTVAGFTSIIRTLYTHQKLINSCFSIIYLLASPDETSVINYAVEDSEHP